VGDQPECALHGESFVERRADLLNGALAQVELVGDALDAVPLRHQPDDGSLPGGAGTLAQWRSAWYGLEAVEQAEEVDRAAYAESSVERVSDYVHCPGRDLERGGDACDATPFCHQLDDGFLPRPELVKRPRAARSCPTRDFSAPPAALNLGGADCGGSAVVPHHCGPSVRVNSMSRSQGLRRQEGTGASRPPQ